VAIDLGTLGTLQLSRTAPALEGEEVIVGIRPEHLTVGGAEFSLTITPHLIEHLGIHTILYADVPGAEHFIALFEGDPKAEEGKPISIGFLAEDVHLFDSAGQAVR
jgi:multiple sugar transport system ATP-binding protein